LAVEVKNSANVTLLSINANAVFLHDEKVLENDVLEWGSAVSLHGKLRDLIVDLNCKWSESEPADR